MNENADVNNDNGNDYYNDGSYYDRWKLLK